MEEEDPEEGEEDKEEEVQECELIHVGAHINVNFVHYTKTIYSGG